MKESIKEPDIVAVLRVDLHGITNFIASECIKVVTANEGKVDVTHPNLQGLKVSMLNADSESKKNEGNATLSLKGTEQGLEKKIRKEIAKGTPEESFAPFRKEMAAHRNKLETQLSSNEGVSSLISAKLKHDLLMESITLLKPDKQDFIDKSTKMHLTHELSANQIKLPKSVANIMLSSSENKQAFLDATKAQINKYFSKEGKSTNDQSCVHDPSKLTPKNITAFSNELTNKLCAVAITALCKKTELGQQDKEAILKSAADLLKTADQATKTQLFADLKKIKSQFQATTTVTSRDAISEGSALDATFGAIYHQTKQDIGMVSRSAVRLRATLTQGSATMSKISSFMRGKPKQTSKGVGGASL